MNDEDEVNIVFGYNPNRTKKASRLMCFTCEDDTTYTLINYTHPKFAKHYIVAGGYIFKLGYHNDRSLPIREARLVWKYLIRSGWSLL
jgi:hypothetical protein